MKKILFGLALLIVAGCAGRTAQQAQQAPQYEVVFKDVSGPGGRYFYIFPEEAGLKPLPFGVYPCRHEDVSGTLSYSWWWQGLGPVPPRKLTEQELVQYGLEVDPKPYWDYLYSK